MTEYWVSQGNKWCDFCKIFLSNNPATIRNHELGQRHKDNVAKKLNDMRKEKAAKDKELKEAARAIEQIEAKAKRSYQKDVANLQEAKETNARVLDVQAGGEEEWEHDSSSGYYYSQSNGLYYDPKSGFYYSDAIGNWVPQEEAYKAVQAPGNPKHGKPVSGKLASSSKGIQDSQKGGMAKPQNVPAPGPVVSKSLNPMRTVKGAASSFAVKRKRQDEKPKAISKEEEAALKAREAAKRRVEEREKPLLGLYSGSWK
ncbi:zinc finger protein ZOP1 [Syzygium oleosum]|uniref:zinc finger protein ZOP1 n=1 Tax=Syzygium oleosum TaxID=219896 RepID=UPI0011D1A053|nr:zinc finger protein ZOP1 [Syzygium oleosum]